MLKSVVAILTLGALRFETVHSYLVELQDTHFIQKSP
jgi:hypothetical protein